MSSGAFNQIALYPSYGPREVCVTSVRAADSLDHHFGLRLAPRMSDEIRALTFAGVYVGEV